MKKSENSLFLQLLHKTRGKYHSIGMIEASSFGWDAPSIEELEVKDINGAGPAKGKILVEVMSSIDLSAF